MPYTDRFEEKFGQNTTVFLTEFDELYADEELLRKIGQLTDLKAINADAQNITDDILASWSGLENLECLILAETLVQDPSRWPDFPLKTLDVSSTMLRDEQIAELARYESLEELNLSNTAITDNGLQQLQSLNSLTQLWLIDAAITDASCDTLNAFPKLDLLEVGHRYTDWGFKGDPYDKLHSPIQVANGRTQGDGVQCSRNEAGLQAARADLVKAVEEIPEKFTPQGSVPKDAKVVAAFPVAPLQTFQLDAIAGQEKITSLAFYSFVPDDQAAHLTSFPNLNTLMFYAAPHSENAFKHIAECASLAYLSLHDTSVTDDDLALLAECQSLRMLDLSGTQVTDAGVEQIAQIKSLEELNLEDTNITEACLASLAGHPNLRLVDVSARMIGDGSSLQRHVENSGFLLRIAPPTEIRFFPFNKLSRFPPRPVSAEITQQLVALADAEYARIVEKHQKDRTSSLWDFILSSSEPNVTRDDVLIYRLQGYEFAPGAARKIPDSVIPDIRGHFEYLYGYDSPELRDAARDTDE